MSHRRLVFGLLWLAGLASLTGCVAAAPDDEAGDMPLGAATQPIMGGTDDAADTSVVDIIWLMGGGFSECSGSLLAPNMVLTAHHCVSNVNNGSQGVSCGVSSFAAPAAASNFYVSTKEVLNVSSPTANAFHKVSQIVVPPNSTNHGFCGVDQAILILSDNIQPSEAPLLVPRVDTHIQAKALYSAVGFGITSDSANDSGTRRRLNDLHIDCVGSTCTSLAPGAIDGTHEFIGDHGTCEGDSGGPALDAQGRVVGVTSRGGVNCSTPIYGDVYDWADWIKQTAQMAASLGGYTAPPWVTGYPTDPAYGFPVGGACDTTCASGFTLDDAAGCYCTRLCETAAPCPTGYTCATIDNVQLCQRDEPASSGSSGSGGGSGAGGGGTSGGGVMFQQSSGCSVSADPTKPVPWLIGVGFAALVQARRRRRSSR